MKNKKQNNKRKNSAAAILAAALAAVWLIVELVVYIGALPSAPLVNGDDFCLTEKSESGFTVDEKKTVQFSPECGAVESISFIVNGEADAVTTVTVAGYKSLTDESSVTYKTEKIAVGNHKDVKNTIYVNIPEQAGAFSLSFGHDRVDYSVDQIVFNNKGDIPFNIGRLLIVWGLLAVVVLMKHHDLFAVCFDPAKKTHGYSALALCVVCVLIAVIMAAMLCPNTEKTTAYPFKYDVNYYNPYEQQFDAFMKAQLHIDYEPSEELLQLENPYDPDQREGVYFLWDRAMYNGKYYSYFGIGPILAVYIPYYWLTGQLPAYDTVSTVFALMTALFLSMAAVKWAAMYTKKLPLPILWIGTIAMIFASQIFLMMRGHARFYYIAIISAMAFLSAFLWLLLCGISGSLKLYTDVKTPKAWKRPVLYAIAGVAYGMCFLSRLNMALLAAFFIVPTVWFAIVTEKQESKCILRKMHAVIPEAAALAAPVVIAVAVHFLLNYMRFDSFFEFGTTYQLTVSDISENKVRLSDLSNAVYHYFLQPLKLTSAVPFVSLFYKRLSDYGHYVYVDTGMGMMAIPMMWALLASPVVSFNKNVGTGQKIALGATILGMLTVALLDFCLGGVIFRYTCDLTLVAAFASMITVFAICDWICCGNSNQLTVKTVKTAATVLMVISVFVCLMLAFSLNANLSAYPGGLFVALKTLFLR